MRVRLALLAATLFLACPHHRPETDAVRGLEAAPRQGPAPRPPTEAERLAAAVDALSAEARAAVRAVDEALWAHWTAGAPLDLEKVHAVHAALYSRQALTTLLRARELGAGDARALSHLERHVTGELLAQALAEDNARMANFEATLTVEVDKKEVSFREVSRLLAAEKSAVKRKALWTRSLEAAARLDAQHAARAEKAREVLSSLELPSMLEFTTEVRELDADALAYAADMFLQLTDATWAATVARLATSELNLPASALTRADLPRLFKVPAGVDAAFPRDQAAARARVLLAGLGLAGEPGITLELDESPRKNPLALTVAPGGPTDVRVSVRPLGGLRDLSVLFAELGHAEALHHATVERFEFRRLGDPGLPHVSGALFAALLDEPAFLADLGVPEALRAQAAATARAQRLFVLRRDAGAVLARLETAGLAEPEARTRYVAVMARALGVKAQAADGVRWRIDTEDLLRSASSFRAEVLAERVRSQLRAAHGPRFWASGASTAALRALWAPGTSRPVEAQLGSVLASVHLLSAAVGGVDPSGGQGEPANPKQLATETPERVRSTSADAGTLAQPWPKPLTVALDAGQLFEGRDPDAGTLARPWPKPHSVARDAGRAPGE